MVHLTGGLSDKGGRFKIATVKPYQGHRDGKSKPKNWEAMREWLESSKTLSGTDFRVVTWQDREADDGIAAAARYAWTSKRTPAIYTRDKDLRMIPGRHVVWTTLARVEVKPDDYCVTDEDGLVYGQKWFWLQMLQGDATDGIPGLEGIPAVAAGKFKACGPKGAEEALDGTIAPYEAYGKVRALYEKFYGQAWAARFAEQAALLWLRADAKADIGDFMRTIPVRVVELEVAVHQMRRRLK